MKSFTQILYQIVFSTKNRENTLEKEGRIQLYKYMWGVIKNKGCHLYRIGGVSNHIHIITHIHPSIALADLVKTIKVASAKFIKETTGFPDFNGWQSGYGAFTYSIDMKDTLINYVKNQEEHHKKITFEDEFKTLLNEHGIAFEEKYLF